MSIIDTSIKSKKSHKSTVQKYARYKDSGVEWLGEIPEHWELKKMKFIGGIFAGISGKKGDDFSKEYSEGIKSFVPFTNICNNLVIDENQYQFVKIDEKENQNRVKKNDILFLMSSETLDEIAKCSIYLGNDDELYLNSFCKGFRITRTEVYPEYINYLLSSKIYRNYFALVGRGFTRINLKQEFINDASVTLPSLEEQTAIAHFLDDKTTKIDQAIAIKEQQINLLKERKQILIHKAVTRGLDDSVALKDSGVEWIGEIPEHWEVKALKYFCFITKLTGFEYTNLWKTDSDGTIIALRGFNVQSAKLDLSEIETISKKLSNSLRRTKLNKNDIVYPCTGTIGNAALINEDNKFHINQNIARICPQPKKVFPKYFLKSLLSYSTKSQIDFNNSSQIQPVILIGSLRNIKISFPSFSEQKQISAYIETASQKIEAAIGLKQQEIAKLKEYKGSLINGVVTGKVKIV